MHSWHSMRSSTRGRWNRSCTSLRRLVCSSTLPVSCLARQASWSQVLFATCNQVLSCHIILPHPPTTEASASHRRATRIWILCPPTLALLLCVCLCVRDELIVIELIPAQAVASICNLQVVGRWRFASWLVRTSSWFLFRKLNTAW